MKLLLDTHIALWATLQSRSLPARARSLIADAANDVAVSVVSIWEIAIKHALARGRSGDMPVSGREARDIFAAAGYTLLPILGEHAVAIDHLVRRHGDPFDRMLVAQAQVEQMSLLTADRPLQAYGDPVLLV